MLYGVIKPSFIALLAFVTNYDIFLRSVDKILSYLKPPETAA